MISKMTIKEYHDADGLSKSMMDILKKSPAHLKYYLDNKDNEQTESMLLGSLLHTILLEPEMLVQVYAVVPEIDRRTASGKQAYAEFLEEIGDKEIITQKQLELANIWAEKINKHPTASEYMKKKSINEASIFWIDQNSGCLCKARPDKIILEDDCIIDLKTAISGQQDDFQRKAHELGYHRQAYWFSEAYKQEFGRDLKKFIFIAVEKTPPYNVVVYEASEFFKEVGGIECRQLMEEYQHCKETNNWYGYDGEKPTEQLLELPNYVIAKFMEEI